MVLNIKWYALSCVFFVVNCFFFFLLASNGCTDYEQIHAFAINLANRKLPLDASYADVQ